MAREHHNELIKTDSYRQTVKYLIQLGYDDTSARRMIREYTLSDDFVNLDDFIKHYVPLSKKVKGYVRGKFFRPDDHTTRFNC